MADRDAVDVARAGLARLNETLAPARVRPPDAAMEHARAIGARCLPGTRVELVEGGGVGEVVRCEVVVVAVPPSAGAAAPAGRGLLRLPETRAVEMVHVRLEGGRVVELRHDQVREVDGAARPSAGPGRGGP